LHCTRNRNLGRRDKRCTVLVDAPTP
jgi:hypothetical protein